jgi:hypothetical protein
MAAKLALVGLLTVLAASAAAEDEQRPCAQGVWPPQRLGRRPSIDPRKWGTRSGNDYGYKVAHCALSAEQLAATIRKVVEGHPRLLLRPRPWEGGLSLAQLRARARREPWAGGLMRMADKTKRDIKQALDGGRPLSPYYVAHPAALYYLATGDESVVPPLVDVVLAAKPAYNCGGGMMSICQIYDWICNSPSLSEEQKRRMRDHIAATAFQCAKVQESGHAFCIFHHRGACGWIADVLVAGLTLHGEHPDAERLLRWGVGYFRKNYFRGWQRLGGRCRGWQRLGGRWSDYHGACVTMPMAIACWASAVEAPNVYEVIRRDYGDWLQGLMYYLMANRLPGKCLSGAVNGCEYGHVRQRITNPNTYMLIARGYRNPDGYAFLRWMGGRWPDPKTFSGLNVLLYDERTDAKRSWFDRNRPFTWMWGRDGNGYVQMRSKGWAPDSTVIEFRCGDYFWSHALNCNQNSFYVYHKGHLAPQSSFYENYYITNHAANYYFRTVSSNSMLVFQPGEFNWLVGWRRMRNRRQAGVDDEGCMPAHGGQRLPYPGHSTNFTYDEYLSRLDAKYHFEMGEITAFERAPDYAWSYVCGDATDAYNNPKYSYACPPNPKRRNRPKIDLFTRSLVYMPAGNNLVVFDRVNALDPSYRKAWLMHTVGRPQVNGKRIGAQVPGHIEDFDGDTVRATWEGGCIPPPDPKDPGRLLVRTFLPAEPTIRRIGGKGYEFWVGGANRPVGPGREKFITPGAYNDPVEPGNWRVEVSPKRPAAFDNFLHLIHIGDTKTRQMPPATMLASAGEKMVGLAVGGRLVMFGRRGEVAGEVRYEAPSGECEHLLVDLKRGARYTLTGIPGGPKVMNASREGVLQFATGQRGVVTLAPVK